MRLFELRRALTSEGHLPGFDGATGWLNSEPLTDSDLRGRVVLADFWTFTCINWIRTAPYLRAWDEKYREHGLTIVGVHTPEFPFERDVDGIRAAIAERRLEYPVAVDSEYAVWSAFANRYWPALYLADAEGAIRYHHFGEGRYDENERAIQMLLDASGELGDELVAPEIDDVEAEADWDALQSPETYLGADRGERFSSPGGAAWEERRSYTTPTPLGLNRWALAGDWTLGAKAVRLDEAGGSLAYRFRSRDVNLVMGPAPGGKPVPFQVRLDGEAPGAAGGADVDEAGHGTAPGRRLYQLVRQPGAVEERTFEITFLEPGLEAYVFTFG